MLRKLWRLLLTLLLLVPPIAWFLYKPVRVLAPQLLGLVCVKETVCVDDVARAAEAAELYDGALRFILANVGDLQKPPRVVFCATDSCYSAFGLAKPTAHTTWVGIIVGPRGWEPHYVRHEMIHHLQIEQLGLLKLGPIRRWRAPEWFIEGMAYYLSDDPRGMLEEPYRTCRRRFQAWYRSVDHQRLWELAKEL